MRIAVQQNTELEQRVADDKDAAIDELARLRADVERLVRARVRDLDEQDELLRALDERFAASRFPFGRDRHVPRITVHGSVGDVSLEAGRRARIEWPEADKRALIDRGYALADRELALHGFPAAEAVLR
jgi:hypothetical protein